MFTNVEEIKENLWACGRLPNQDWNEGLKVDL